MYYNCVLTNYTQNDKVIIERCNECIDESLVGSDTKEEDLAKIKKSIGWLGDIFYSFKDDFENILTEAYRSIKKLEHQHEDTRISTDSRNDNGKTDIQSE